MLSILRGLDGRRKALAKKAPEGPLRQYYEVPYADPKADCRDVEYVALDLETTGLLASKHEIVSAGWVPVRNMRVELSGCHHQLVKPDNAVSEESITIHHIFESHLEDAPTLEYMLSILLPEMAGKVMIAHHSKIEWKFIDAACRKVYGQKWEIPTVDTLLIEKRMFDMRNEPIKPGSLRLDAVRQRYNMPRYKAHNAMIDAIACAEVYLAQIQYRAGKEPLPLRAMTI
ncbi:MAG: exonuclease domain-containing protein [Magnetovibrionaceae bacterium]